MQISENVFSVGVNDYAVDFFEGLYKVPNGVSYNSYVIKDDKIAVLDTVDRHFKDEWLANVSAVLGGKSPDYLIVQHMEPDHSANVLAFAQKYPQAVIVGNQKIFVMLGEYFGTDFADRRVVVSDGETLSLGKRTLKFVFAPMVHWPEVMFTYDEYSKTLFSADAFGKFGALDCKEGWVDEARRYYIGIVGKYGKQVTAVLNKLSAYEINAICPLHGPVLNENLGYFLGLYTTWASYEPETDGVMIAYASVYGHTEVAALELKKELESKGIEVYLCDLVRCDRSQAVAQAFRYSKLVLASTTYNADVFPQTARFIDCLVARNYQNRAVGLIENGTWAPVAAKVMKDKLSACKNIKFAENSVKIRSNLNEESRAQIIALADELSQI